MEQVRKAWQDLKTVSALNHRMHFLLNHLTSGFRADQDWSGVYDVLNYLRNEFDINLQIIIKDGGYVDFDHKVYYFLFTVQTKYIQKTYYGYIMACAAGVHENHWSKYDMIYNLDTEYIVQN